MLPFAYDDEITVGIGNPWRQGNSGDPGAASTGPSILDASQHELGLKLESTKAPMEVLVVDHAERPAEN